ncbi:MAG: cryptochrome/photolyase family protein [Anaerolineae bacterium]
MTQAALIYPHQLFAQHPALSTERLVVLVEDPLFFGDPHYPARFHRMKLALHRASMKRYAAEALREYRVRYVEYAEAATGRLLGALAAEGIRELFIADPVDFMLEKRLTREAARHTLTIHWLSSPAFLNTRAEIDAFYAERTRYHQTDFYIWQRKKHNLLLAEGKPLGGRWTFDTENRQKLKPNVPVPDAPAPYTSAFIDEARAYVRQRFPANIGQMDNFIYPTNHAEAAALLDAFLQRKLAQFGPYQDAITHRAPFVFHSLLSASINIGLLTPAQVVARTLDYFEAHPQTALASVEGFLRQIVGWREFMRAVYMRAGVQQRTSNFWGQARPLDERWYSGTLGIPPVDDAIRKALRYAYNHHIERLMLIGNLMMLCDIHPDEVYRWFMEMFIDAYDWVMVPNVYGMSQYADGGLITTKPYLSSSNYIRKMSDYKAGAWCDTWDSLYWRFVHQHAAFFRGSPRLSVMASHLDRMSAETLAAHYARAEAFLA